MGTFDPNKRKFVKTVGAISIGMPTGIIATAFPATSRANPILYPIITGLIAAWAAIFVASVQARSNERIANSQNDLQRTLAQFRAGVDMQMARYQMSGSSNTVLDEAAFDKQGNPVSRTMAPNVDGWGTTAGVIGGWTYFGRGSTAGYLTSVEALTLAQGLESNARLPVPSSGYYDLPASGQADVGYQVAQFVDVHPRSVVPLAARRFNTAPEARNGEWDLNVLHWVNRDDRARGVRVTVLPKNQLAGHRPDGMWTLDNIWAANCITRKQYT